MCLLVWAVWMLKTRSTVWSLPVHQRVSLGHPQLRLRIFFSFLACRKSCTFLFYFSAVWAFTLELRALKHVYTWICRLFCSVVANYAKVYESSLCYGQHVSSLLVQIQSKHEHSQIVSSTAPRSILLGCVTPAGNEMWRKNSLLIFVVSYFPFEFPVMVTCKPGGETVRGQVLGKLWDHCTLCHFLIISVDVWECETLLIVIDCHGTGRCYLVQTHLLLTDDIGLIFNIYVLFLVLTHPVCVKNDQQSCMG